MVLSLGGLMKKKSLEGKVAFIAGVGDDQGFGWAIAKALAEEGAKILVGTWPPIYKIFTSAFQNGKFDESRKLSDGSMLEIEKVYPLDAAFDTPEEVPEDIKNNKRYRAVSEYTISEVAKAVKRDFGSVDMLMHSLANAPEIKNSLLETSRNGYLAALSSSSYSFVSLLRHFGPYMPKGASAATLSYLASEKVIPGYGGGMSSAKAALESDTRTLAFEAGRKWQIRVNAISAGALSSRAAKAIGFIEKMIHYSKENAPLQKDLFAEEVAQAARFLLSKDSSAITGTLLYVDNGLHTMGLAVDSESLAEEHPVIS